MRTNPRNRLLTTSLAAITLLLGGCGSRQSPQANRVDNPDDPEAPAAIGVDEATVADLPRTSLARLRSVQAVLKPDPAYTVQDEVGIAAPFYVFRVESAHGVYDVKGTQNLMQLLYELRVIEAFRQGEHGSEVMSGAGQYIKNTGKGAVNLVVHPVASVKALGRLPFRFMRSVGRTAASPFIKKNETDSEGHSRVAISKGFLYSKEVRKVAYEMGVDVYSQNPYLQGVLHSVSKQRSSGSFLVQGALFFVSPGGSSLAATALEVGKWGRRALTPGGRHEVTEMLIRDNDSNELKRINAREFEDDLGLKYEKGAPAYEFLNNFSYSPREKTYARLYLADIKPRGLDDALRFLAESPDMETAIFNYHQFSLLHAIHHGDARLTRLLPVGGRLAAVNTRGELMLVVPWDVVQNDAQTRALLEAVKQANGTLGRGRNAQLWFTGDVDMIVWRFARDEGVTVRGNILRDAMFKHYLQRWHAPPKQDRDGRGPAE